MHALRKFTTQLSACDRLLYVATTEMHVTTNVKVKLHALTENTCSTSIHTVLKHSFST